MMPHIAVAVNTCTAVIDPSARHMQLLRTVLIRAQPGMVHGSYQQLHEFTCISHKLLTKGNGWYG